MSSNDSRAERYITILAIITIVLSIIALVVEKANGAQRGPVTTYGDGCWTTPLHCGRMPNSKCPVCGLQPNPGAARPAQEFAGIGLLVRCPKCNAAYFMDKEDK